MVYPSKNFWCETPCDFFCLAHILLIPPFSVLRLQAPPPSVHSGISVLEEALSRKHKQGSGVEGAPPTYSEVIGHYYHPTTLTSNHQTVSSSQASPSTLIHGLLRPLPQQPGSVDNRNTRNTKEKSQKPQQVWQDYFLLSLVQKSRIWLLPIQIITDGLWGTIRVGSTHCEWL